MRVCWWARPGAEATLPDPTHQTGALLERGHRNRGTGALHAERETLLSPDRGDVPLEVVTDHAVLDGDRLALPDGRSSGALITSAVFAGTSVVTCTLAPMTCGWPGESGDPSR
jgi:hypothetical protein